MTSATHGARRQLWLETLALVGFVTAGCGSSVPGAPVPGVVGSGDPTSGVSGVSGSSGASGAGSGTSGVGGASGAGSGPGLGGTGASGGGGGAGLAGSGPGPGLSGAGGGGVGGSGVGGGGASGVGGVGGMAGSNVGQITYRAATGLGVQNGVVRRDPSDVIKVGNVYYVWYTKVLEGQPSYPEGYAHGTIWYASSPDGLNWTEKGQALGLGAPGKFDDYACFTPNILYSPETNRYYLYYTGVSNTRGVDATTWVFDENPGHIGVAVATSPDGVWQRANNGDPILSARTSQTGVLDGWHVDDTVMFYRPGNPEGSYWFYYKGHSLPAQKAGTPYGEQPGRPAVHVTPMHLAVSMRPDGGFARRPLSQTRDHLVTDGHELLVWRSDATNGTSALATGHYNPNIEGGRYRVHTSADGLAFAVEGGQPSGIDQLRAGGAYRPDLTDPQSPETGLRWGIAMTSYGAQAGLHRFDVSGSPPRDPPPLSPSKQTRSRQQTR